MVAYIPEPEGQAKLSKANFVGVLRSHYKQLHDANVPIMVFIGELERGSGLIRYSGADPISDKPTEGN